MVFVSFFHLLIEFGWGIVPDDHYCIYDIQRGITVQGPESKHCGAVRLGAR